MKDRPHAARYSWTVPLTLAILLGTASSAQDQAQTPRPGPWLGVNDIDVACTGRSGSLLIYVDPESSAGRAGLRPGDLVSMFGDTVINTPDDLGGAIRRSTPGEQVSITILRNGEAITLLATLGSKVPHLQDLPPVRPSYIVQGKVIDMLPGQLLLWGRASPVSGAPLQFWGEARILVLAPVSDPSLRVGVYQGLHCFIERRLGPLWVFGNCQFASGEIDRMRSDVELIEMMKREVLEFVDRRLENDRRAVGWVHETLSYTPRRALGFWKFLKADPNQLMAIAKDARRFPCE